MAVLKYFIGGLICVCFIIFCVKQIKSLIVDLRNRRNKKSSGEGKSEVTGEPPAEGSEKEVDK